MQNLHSAQSVGLNNKGENYELKKSKTSKTKIY